MPILTKTECAQYTDAIIVAVFTDRVSAYAVKKTAAGISLLASAMENREEARPNDQVVGQGETNEENIRFNCQKVLQKMPSEHLFIRRPVIFLLDAALSDCSFVSVDAKREQKDSPISDVELNTITAKYYGNGKESESVFRNFPIEYLVDGFAVPQPLSLNGQNITARMVTVSVLKALESAFLEVASAHGLVYAGMMGMSQLIAESSVFIEGDDSISIAVFQDITALVLARNKHCAGIGTVPLGYGILEQEAAKAFVIGTQETRTILGIWQKKQTDESVKLVIDGIAVQCADALKERLKKAFAALEPEHLLPASFTVMQFGNLTQPAQGIALSADWLNDTPVARNAHLKYMEDSGQGIVNPDEVLKDHPESAADLFLVSALLR